MRRVSIATGCADERCARHSLVRLTFHVRAASHDPPAVLEEHESAGRMVRFAQCANAHRSDADIDARLHEDTNQCQSIEPGVPAPTWQPSRIRADRNTLGDYWRLSAFSGDRQYPKAGGCLLRSSDSNPGQSDRSRDIGAEGDRGALLTASPTAGPSSTKRLGRPWAAGRRARAAASRSGRGATGCASPSASTPRRP